MLRSYLTFIDWIMLEGRIKKFENDLKKFSYAIFHRKLHIYISIILSKKKYSKK